MTGTHGDERFKGGKVLLGLDGSDANGPAVEWAFREAHVREAEFQAVYAWHVPMAAYSAPVFVPADAEQIEIEAQEIMATALSGLPDEMVVKRDLVVREGRPDEVLRELADDPAVTIAVVGTRGRGSLTGLVLGSVSHSLSHNCPKPLVIVPSHDAESTSQPPHRITVGIDGSDGSAAALAWAAGEARLHDAELQVVTVSPRGAHSIPTELEVDRRIGPSMWRAAESLIEQAVEPLDVADLDVTRTVRDGRPAEVLLDEASSSALLVVGKRGLGRAREVMLGSVSHAVLHGSKVPVAVIPNRPVP